MEKKKHTSFLNLNTDAKGPQSSGDKAFPLPQGPEIKRLKTSTYVQCSLVISYTAGAPIIHVPVTGIGPATLNSYFWARFEGASLALAWEKGWFLACVIITCHPLSQFDLLSDWGVGERGGRAPKKVVGGVSWLRKRIWSCVVTMCVKKGWGRARLLRQEAAEEAPWFPFC